MERVFKLEGKDLIEEKIISEVTIKGNALPLGVDLDGTLVKTDTLVESILILLKRQPLLLFSMLLWMLRGKAFFKQQIANRVDLPVDSLPYHPEFLAFLQQEFQKGRKLVLVTAANEKIANSVAEHLGIFSAVWASNEKDNLSGKKKLAFLEEKLGKREFVYAGNGNVDLPIWKGAFSGIVVNASSGLVRKAKEKGNITLVFSDKNSFIKHFVREIRVHQWVKNLLIFIPLITSHSFTNTQMITQAILAFFSFSFCASSVYVLNDLMDLDADRRHSKKRKRPFAAGNLSLKTGIVAFPLLLIPSFLIASFLNPLFLATLATYFFITFAYSISLKKLVLVDVFTLAFLFTLRIFSGAAAIDVFVSQWLFAFSIFIFVSLAFVKRFTELQNMEKDKLVVNGRGYLSGDFNIVGNFGIASAYISIVIFALYINSDQVKLLYSYPQILWSICVLLFFWVSRVWLLAYRGEMNEDPILFAVKDKVSYIVGFLAAVAIFFAN